MTTLEQLPERMDRLESQILQFREEVRSEFSAVRADMAAGDGETRRTLREEIRAGDEETRRFSRVLHEDVIGRISLMGEALSAHGDALARLSSSLEQSRVETRAMFDALLSRATAIETRLPPPRRRKK